MAESFKLWPTSNTQTKLFVWR